jgi:hypothetical protein
VVFISRIISGIFFWFWVMLCVYSFAIEMDMAEMFVHQDKSRTRLLINRHMIFLQRLDENCLKSGIHLAEMMEHDFLEQELLKTGVARWCSALIERTGTLKVLFEFWGFLTKYEKNMPIDKEVLHDIALLLFVYYHQANILLKNEEGERISLEDITELYRQISRLPLKDLFEAIHILYYDLKDIFHQYPLEEGESLADWFKKYWWAPFVFLTTVSSQFIGWLYFSNNNRTV